MNSIRQHVIVGAGTAGISAVEALRKAPSDDSITLISAESDAPYSPTVLPHLLAGRIDERQVALRSADFFDRARCRLMLGRTVTGLDAERRTVSLDDGSRVSFDRLLLAVGSEPLMPKIENPDRVECLSFTRIGDLRTLRTRLKRGSRVAILGAGLIGMELADALAHLPLGIRVLVVEQEKQVLPRTFNETLADEVLELFQNKGVAFALGRRAAALEKTRDGIAVTLSDASAHVVDLVVACVGVRPRIGFLAGSGVAVGRGILADRRMATNLAGIYAAGDAAEGFSADGAAGCHPVLPTAAAQGRVAGANMADRPAGHEGWLPANFFNFFGKVAVSVGDASAGPERESLKRSNGAGHAELFFEGERLVGANFLGVPTDPGSLSMLIKKRVAVKEHRELLLNRPLEASRWLAARAQRGERVK